MAQELEPKAAPDKVEDDRYHGSSATRGDEDISGGSATRWCDSEVDQELRRDEEREMEEKERERSRTGESEGMKGGGDIMHDPCL